MARHYEDSETRRRQVAQAALQTIAEEGVAQFTTRAVAKRVGISEGTLFRHFGNKQEVALEAMALLEIEIDEGLVETGVPMADLEAFFRHRTALVGADGSVGRLIFSDTLVHLAGEEGRVTLDRWRNKSVGYLSVRLKALHQANALNPALDVVGANTLFQGVLLTFAMQAALGRGGSKKELQKRIDWGWTTLVAAIFQADPA